MGPSIHLQDNPPRCLVSNKFSEPNCYWGPRGPRQGNPCVPLLSPFGRNRLSSTQHGLGLILRESSETNQSAVACFWPHGFDAITTVGSFSLLSAAGRACTASASGRCVSIRAEPPVGGTALFGGAVRAYGWRVRATLTSGAAWVFMWLLYEAGEPAWFLGKYVAEDLSEATCSGMTAESDARMASGEGHASQAGLFLPSFAASGGRRRRL